MEPVWPPEVGSIVIAIDDTSLPKTGHRIDGTRWCHDPLAPPFLDKRLYGEPLPRPIEYRRDPALPEQKLDLHYGGRLRTIKFKEVPGVLWKDGTKSRLMRLLIVLPIPYRVPGKRKHGYNAEAFLLTTDLETPASQLIQAYLDRWQIEVLHRELKSGLGVGQIQCWNKKAVGKIHGAHVAAFSMLLLAAQDVFGGTRDGNYPDLALWRRIPPMRPSVHDLLTRLRNDLVRTGFFGKTKPGTVPYDWVLPHRETYQAA